MELKTVKKSDPEYQKLLEGTFSKIKRAIPLRPMNQHISFELATFEILPIDEIEKPKLLTLTNELLKPQHFLIVLVPFLLTLFSLSFEAQKILAFKSKVALLFLSLLSLTFYMNLQRTLTEHFQLTHLFASAPASSILQKAWMSGITVRRLSWLCLGIAILLATPLIFEQPDKLLPLVLITLILHRGMHLQKEGKLYLVSSAVNHLLLSGPLVMLGTCMVFQNPPQIYHWAFAFAWGLWILLWRQLKSFREVMPFSLSKSSRFVAQMGFDKTQSLLRTLIISVPMISLGLLSFFPNAWIWVTTTALIHSYFIVKELECLNKIQSSLSSHLEDLAHIAQKHHYVYALVLILIAMLNR
jgi:hypothetical protein